MLLCIISIAANVAFFFVLNARLYTDRAVLPDGGYREWRRSPIDRLYISDMRALLYLQIALAAVSVISGVLVLFSVKSSAVRTVWLVSTIASALMFVVILIVTGNSHVRYA